MIVIDIVIVGKQSTSNTEGTSNSSATLDNRGYDVCINCYNNDQQGLFVVVLLLFQWLFVVVSSLTLWYHLDPDNEQ